MAITPVSWTTAKSNIDLAIREVSDAEDELARILARLASLQAAVGGFGAKYGATAAFIDAQAQANAGNAAWKGLEAQKDAVVPDFQSLKARIDALKAAVDGVV